MGRWGYGIYDSDSSLDFLDAITDLLIKQAAYQFSPEQVYQGVSWLQEALTLVEMMILLEEDDFDASPSHLRDQYTAVRRWRDAFLSVWDAEWDSDWEPNLPYRHFAYRLEHRHTVNILFDRLIELADEYRDDLPPCDLQPFALKGQLPHFSVVRITGRDGREFSHSGRFLEQFINGLMQRIVFALSEENLEKETGIDLSEIEGLCVAVDMLGYLCAAYRVSPVLRPATIHHMLDKVTGLWIEYFDHPERSLDLTKDEFYANVVTAFVRLMTVAQQYPVRWAL